VRDWAHGDLDAEFERRLDEILAEVSPEWVPAPPPGSLRDEQRFRDYWRRNVKRMHLGDVLKARRDVAAERAEAVLAAVVCDEDVSFNNDDDVADLRARYRNACLAAFVACDHAPTRERLSLGFLLVEACYPPDLHHLVQAARAVAAADPERYRRLLDATDDGTSMAHVGSGGT
jgi:hypothetical protein